MEVDIKELIKRVKDLKNRLHNMNYYEGLEEDLDNDDFTLAVVIVVLEGINEQENE